MKLAGSIAIALTLAFVASCAAAATSAGCSSDDECGVDERCVAPGTCQKVSALEPPAGCRALTVEGRPFLVCEAAPFAQASALCTQARGTLLRFDDDASPAASLVTEEALQRALAPFSIDGVWLALRDSTREGSFAWEDAAPLDTSDDAFGGRFAAGQGARVHTLEVVDGQPDDRTGEDCVEVLPDGQWDDLDCEKLDQTVCESATPFGGAPEDCSSTTIDGRSYLFCTLFRLGESASDVLCRIAGGAVLQVADNATAAADERERTQVHEAARAAGVDFYWLDLSDRVVEDQFVWGNGVVLDRAPEARVSFFAPGEPSASDGQDCVTMTTNGWDDVDCASAQPVVCELR